MKGDFLIKPKMLILLLLSAMTLTACADIPPIKEPVPAEQQTVIPAPEDGWTAAELMSVTYFDGIELCYPMSVRDFGAAYDISTPIEDQGRSFYYLTRDTISMSAEAYITLEYNDTKISADDEIRSLSAYQDNMSVNGLKKSSPAADVQNALGTPDRIDEPNNIISEYYYCDKETGNDLLCISVGKENNDVTGFEIFLK